MLLVDGLFPLPCCLCGEPIDPILQKGHGSRLCAACADALAIIEGDRCGTCGKPLVSEQRSCLDCRGRSYAFERCIAGFLYSGLARDLIHAYKFASDKALSRPLAEAMARQLDAYGETASWRMGACVLVPVPSTRQKRRKRGWDPVKRLTIELVRKARSEGGRPRWSYALARLPGEEQKSLDFKGRMVNLKGKISARNRCSRSIIGAAVILVDDVFTTGATLTECARVLREAGAERVFGIVAAVDA